MNLPVMTTHRKRRLRLFVLVLGVLASALAVRGAYADTIHVVAPGHTLAKIARRYHTSVEALREANRLSPRDKLRPGQRLVIPSADSPGKSAKRKVATTTTSPRPASPPTASQPSLTTTHLVARGHTLGKIASRYQTTVAQLQELNGLKPSEPLQPGQCLLVPTRKPVPKSQAPCTVAATTARQRSYVARPARPGVVRLMRGSLAWAGRVVDRNGRPIDTGMDKLSDLMRSGTDGAKHAIDPRLAALLTKVSDHFGGRTIHIVSGYRPPESSEYTHESRHHTGQAVDFYIEGVPNDVLRDYCHSFAGTGVGYYPRSSFVHLDVRPITTRWVDESGPGEAPRYTSVTSGPPAAAASK